MHRWIDNLVTILLLGGDGSKLLSMVIIPWIILKRNIMYLRMYPSILLALLH